MKVNAYLKIGFRIIQLIFRHERKLHKIQLYCDRQFLFKQGVVKLYFAFQNVLYYKINGKLVLNNTPLFFNVEKNPIIEFKAVGLFKKKKYSITISATHAFDNSAFVVANNGPKPDLRRKKSPVLALNDITILNSQINITITAPDVQIPDLKINHQLYNLNEFV